LRPGANFQRSPWVKFPWAFFVGGDTKMQSEHLTIKITMMIQLWPI